jgi:hypothetical protein
MKNLLLTRRVAGVALLGFVMALASGLVPVRAADTDKETGKRKAIESKLEKPKRLAGKDFAGDLGVDLENLRTLGARIDQARANADPVCLALLARELAIAENLSKKKTEPTSADLMAEAVKMAKARNRPEELRAVAQLATKDKDDLLAAADKAEKQIQARKEGGAGSKGITGTLYVENHTSQDIKVFVNFRYVGTVPPYTTGRLYVGDSPSETTFLNAETSSGGTAARVVTGSVGQYTWQLH